jgi:DME family drug/metabolite transporter
MRPSMTARRPGTGLLYLITSGLLWGTGGLIGSLLSRVADLSALSVAACRLTAGGVRGYGGTRGGRLRRGDPDRRPARAWPG